MVIKKSQSEKNIIKTAKTLWLCVRRFNIKKDGNAFTKEKKSILFLHGYLCDKTTFAYQIPFFARGFNVFALDLKGFGQNKDMEFPFSLNDYVDEVKRYIKENNIVKPNVIAHSFGCRIAIKMASENTDVFDKLVLTGAAGLKPKTSFKKTVKRSAFTILSKFIDKKRLEGFYSSDYKALSPVMRESFKKIVNEHLDGEIHKIKNQTLLVFGANDKDTPLYMARKLNKGIENSKLIIMKNAGHFCFIDKKATFNTEVKEFLLS